MPIHMVVQLVLVIPKLMLDYSDAEKNPRGLLHRPTINVNELMFIC